MPAACRIGDKDLVHCSQPARAEGSANVYVNGLPWSCQGHINTPHTLPGSPCPTHAAAITGGSATVRVNGKAAGRIGDAIGGCTAVAAGSNNVFCGG
jgi:uncharacterized Zn-binding protein involved in type VI secretion